MSHSNFNPKLYASDDVQFKIVSRSAQHGKAGTTMSASGSDYEPRGTHLPSVGHQKLNQVVMNDTTDIFNDGIEGGGVEPSINESIRQSIQCSFVSSECGEAKQKYQDDMSMNWITYLKVLFDQLETFNQNKQKHVETANFLKGLKKIKNLLPLLSRNDYYKNSSEVAFTYKEVEIGVTKMPKYITWDNVIDIFLTKSFATQQPSAANTQAFQQISSDELYQKPQAIDDSRMTDGYYDEVEVDNSYQDRYSDNRGGKGKQQKQIINKNSLGMSGGVTGTVEIQQNPKRKRNDDFFLSFADSLVHHGNMQFDSSNHQQLVAQAPLLGGPNIGLKENDDDEACEIDSEYSEEEIKNNSNSRRQRSKLEESIRSSRTATFKSVRRTSTHQAAYQSANFNQSSQQLNSALSQALNVQDSYYQTIKNSAMPQNYVPQQQLPQQQVYYQQSVHSKHDSRNSNQYYIDHNEDGQVEVASQHSYGSQKWRTMDNGGSLKNGEDQMNNEKSTRLSSLNSITKNPNMNQNNTILSQESSHSSQHYLRINQNNSKISSAGKTSSSTITQSNFVDMDLQGKNLKNFEIDYKTGTADKRQLRSVNFANNLLIKLPTGLEKTLQYMNVSYNKLKSLNGIESCVNLKFLNVSGNQLSSANNLAHLQSMRELIFAYNQLSLLKEIGQLKNLQLLDISYNKIIEFEKLDPLQNLKKLTTLSLQGNLMHKISNYEAVVQRKLPWVKILDPDCIKDFSQFSDMEHICFSNPPDQLNGDQGFVIVEQLSQNNLQRLNNEHDIESKPRSRTPNRDRPKSQLRGMPTQLKSTVISPQRNIIEGGGHGTPKSYKSQIPQTGRASNINSNDSQFKLQSKLSTQVPTKITVRGQVSQRNSQLPASIARDRSNTYEQPKSTIEESKSQTRERSTSNISRNAKQKQFFTQGLNSGRSTAQQSVNSQQLQHQHTNQSVKEGPMKRIAVNPNIVKSYGSQGKITPRRISNQTPRQEKPNNYYKKSFCTEEESSFQRSAEKDMPGTPSEKNTVRTAQTQDSSVKKPGARAISRKNETQLQNADMGIYSPQGKVVKAPTILAPKQAQARPITTLKQRINTQAQQIQGQNPNYTTNPVQSSNAMLQAKLGMPQSTKNSNFSQSFVFENTTATQGRSTPNSSQQVSNRPSSQLQKFINNSGRQGQAQPALQSSRPSTQAPNSVLSVHPTPSQKLTNLPPKAYVSTKSGNPGDKKSKADMSLSMISQSNSSQQHSVPGTNNNSTSHLNISGHNSQIKQSSILHGTTNNFRMEDNSHIDSISSRSMSPVLEESNNIKKLKVDLTQFMNKQ